MTADLRKALGARVAHITARSNLPGIRSYGLFPAAKIAQLAGVDADDLLLRANRRVLSFPSGTAQLNHQRPIASHLRAATAMLDGHTPDSWAAALDHRVFLWPEPRINRFAASIARDVDIATLWLNTDRLLALFKDHLDLSPINSGNFSQGGAHARRGDWLYVPATQGLAAFRENRRARGLVKTPDSVTELSLRRAIPPTDLENLLETIT